MQKKIILGVLISLALTAAAFYFLREKPIAVIGDWSIYKSDANFRDQIILQDFPDEKRSVGAYQLAKSAIHKNILDNNHYKISDAQIENESLRIDQTTQAPEKLAQIKKIFGDDHKAYLKNFILPNLVDRAIYTDFFTTSDDVHKESLNQTIDFIKKTLSEKKSLAESAKFFQYTIKKASISEKDGLVFADDLKNMKMLEPKSGAVQQNQKNLDLYNKVKNHLDSKVMDSKNIHPDYEKWQNDILQHVQIGQILPNPINQNESWWVIQVLNKDKKNTYELDVVVIPKIKFDDWFKFEKTKVKVQIMDATYLWP
jgi:hypothetical protein